MKLLTKKATLITALCMFVFAMFGSLFFGSLHIDAEPSVHSAHDCPFMIHDNSFCLMDFVDHISAWKDVFVFPIALTFFFILSVAISSVRKIVFLFVKTNSCQQQREVWNRISCFCYKFFEHLFSKGILHPKLF